MFWDRVIDFRLVKDRTAYFPFPRDTRISLLSHVSLPFPILPALIPSSETYACAGQQFGMMEI
jgi:hypothetical protein